MKNNAPFQESDVCHSRNSPTINQCVQKVPTHEFRMQTPVLGDCISASVRVQKYAANSRQQALKDEGCVQMFKLLFHAAGSESTNPVQTRPN